MSYKNIFEKNKQPDVKADIPLLLAKINTYLHTSKQIERTIHLLIPSWVSDLQTIEITKVVELQLSFNAIVFSTQHPNVVLVERYNRNETGVIKSISRSLIFNPPHTLQLE